MIMSENICGKCGKIDIPVFLSVRHGDWLCSACQRMHNPPYMTITDIQGRFWNLEVGEYETLNTIEEIEWCGWFVRSKQKTLLSRVPKLNIIVYHLEFHGTVACGRCINYPYFEKNEQECMSVACEPLAKPHRDPKDITYPPVQSRFTKWARIRSDNA